MRLHLEEDIMIRGLRTQLHFKWLKTGLRLHVGSDGIYERFASTCIYLQCVHLPEHIPGLLPVPSTWFVQHIAAPVKTSRFECRGVNAVHVVRQQCPRSLLRHRAHFATGFLTT